MTHRVMVPLIIKYHEILTIEPKLSIEYYLVDISIFFFLTIMVEKKIRYLI